VTAPLDRQLVAALCRDGRADVRALAAQTDAVATTVQKRLRALEDDGTIEGYTARLDYGRLGYETVIFRLAVGMDAIDDVTARLRQRPAFVTVYQACGSYPVFAVGKYENEAAHAACLRELHDDPDVDAVETKKVRSVVSESRSPLAGN
jgi:DNA-binding Lrp family transcriptional regulator